MRRGERGCAHECSILIKKPSKRVIYRENKKIPRLPADPYIGLIVEFVEPPQEKGPFGGGNSKLELARVESF